MVKPSEAISAARIFTSIADELEATQREIEKQLAIIDSAALHRFDELTHRALHHLFRVRGKHLRPSLVLLTALATGKPNAFQRDVLPRIAAAVELIHSASLVHDDVIDEADTRRGQPALNATDGNKVAVLTGDLLYDQAFALLTQLTDLGHQRQIALFELFTTTTRMMCLGEMYEDQIEADPAVVSFEDYLKVIDYKTASLMACCCEASCIIMETPDEARTRMSGFGHQLGMSYQLIDDVNDHDSVFYNGDIMVGRAVQEANLAGEALSHLPTSTYRDRLSEMPAVLLRRAERVVPAAMYGES